MTEKQKTDLDLKEIVKAINKEIAGLNRYGYRKVKAPHSPKNEWCILTWSNGCREWIPYADWASKPKNGYFELDANQLVVPYSQDFIIDNKITAMLIELPLYQNSTEAKFGNIKDIVNDEVNHK